MMLWSFPLKLIQRINNKNNYSRILQVNNLEHLENVNLFDCRKDFGLLKTYQLIECCDF